MKRFTKEEYDDAVTRLKATETSVSLSSYCKDHNLTTVDGIYLFTYIIVSDYCRASNAFHYFLNTLSTLWSSGKVLEMRKKLDTDVFLGSLIFPPDIIIPTVNRIVATVLSSWLENDQEHTQTINSFVTELTKARTQAAAQKGNHPTANYGSREKFLSKSEQKRQPNADSPTCSNNAATKNISRDDMIYKAYRRAEAVFMDMQILQEEQARAEKKPVTPIWFSEKTQNAKNGNNTKNRYYNFPTLCTIQLLANDHSNNLGEAGAANFLSPLFNLLVYRKQSMCIAKDPLCLLEAYEHFDKMVAHFKGTSSDREYVAFCMAFMKIEYAFRFHLMGLLAKYQHANGIPLNSELPLAAKLFWYRGDFLAEQADLLDYSDKPNNVLPPIGQISAVYSGDEAAFLTLQYTRAVRELFSTVLPIVFQKLQPMQLKSWTDSDFKTAAAFFRKDYPIIEDYVPVNLSEVTDNPELLCKRLTHLYNTITGPIAKSFRQSMQDSKRARRKSTPRTSE